MNDQDQQPIPNDQQPITAEQQPNTADQQPITADQQPDTPDTHPECCDECKQKCKRSFWTSVLNAIIKVSTIVLAAFGIQSFTDPPQPSL